MSNIVNLVCSKIRTLNPQHLVMYWHHCVLHLFKYLLYDHL